MKVSLNNSYSFYCEEDTPLELRVEAHRRASVGVVLPDAVSDCRLLTHPAGSWHVSQIPSVSLSFE